MDKIVISNDHVTGFGAGYVVGLGVTILIAGRDLKRAHRDHNRALELTKQVLNESWAYLPNDAREKLDTEIKFFNIAIKEDL